MTLFAGIFVPDELRAAVSERAWLEGMLAAERALANAEAAAGLIPADAAVAIAAQCRAELFDTEELARRGRSSGNPVEPLARALREAVGGDAARYVHFGATSQDILDTAAMLVARRGVALVLRDLDRTAAAAAALAKAHRSTPMAGRTLLQHAVPITFGLKAAGWLVAVLDARLGLRRLSLAAQLGGAAGTLAPLGDRALEVLALYAAELQLDEPVLTWHSSRGRIAELGAALAIAAGAAGKIALDVALLSQTEVAEVAEPSPGGSSTMPQKRNPVGSTVALACARQAAAQSAVLTGALVQEHERAIGAWHAEWDALSNAIAFSGGAVAAVAAVLEGLDVDAERMRRNLDSTGMLAAERVAFLLAERLGRKEAHELVAGAAAGGSLAAGLAADPRVWLSEAELEAALDATTYLGSAEAFVDRALERYEA